MDRIGFIGLGLMGKPMALNLLKKGFPLTVHSRSQAPVDALVEAGAASAPSPAGVAAASDVIITMVPDSSDVRSVLEGPGGVFEAAREGPRHGGREVVVYEHRDVRLRGPERDGRRRIRCSTFRFRKEKGARAAAD